MEKVKSRLIMAAPLFVMVFILQAFAPRPALAQSAAEPTRISVGAPAQANTGERITVQAVLVDSHGNPISKATVYFTTHTAFLTKSGDVVLAQAVTNKDGQAVAEFADDFSGAITLRAEFRGDEQHAPSNATAQVGALGQEQVYAEHIGVDIPGFNVPPMAAPLGSAPMASLQSPGQGVALSLERLWPAMNGWPIAAALIIVWSLYFRAVTLLFRIAKPVNEAEESTTADRRRSL